MCSCACRCCGVVCVLLQCVVVRSRCMSVRFGVLGFAHRPRRSRQRECGGAPRHRRIRRHDAGGGARRCPLFVLLLATLTKPASKKSAPSLQQHPPLRSPRREPGPQVEPLPSPPKPLPSPPKPPLPPTHRSAHRAESDPKSSSSPHAASSRRRAASAAATSRLSAGSAERTCAARTALARRASAAEPQRGARSE